MRTISTANYEFQIDGDFATIIHRSESKQPRLDIYPESHCEALALVKALRGMIDGIREKYERDDFTLPEVI